MIMPCRVCIEKDDRKGAARAKVVNAVWRQEPDGKLLLGQRVGTSKLSLLWNKAY